DLPFAQGLGQGAQRAGDRAVPAQPLAGTAYRQAPGHGRPARIARHRAGRRHHPVHLPRRVLQQGKLAGQETGRGHHRQAPNRPYRFGQAALLRRVHPLRQPGQRRGRFVRITVRRNQSRPPLSVHGAGTSIRAPWPDRATHTDKEYLMNIRKQTLAMFGTAALVAVLAAGCQTTNPYTGEQQMNRTSKGALIGAGIGAAAGLLTGKSAVERRQHALIGAGVGGLAGGTVGAYQDRQQAALRAKLQGTGVSVTRNGDNITLNMPGNVTFGFNSSNLDPQFYPVLSSVADVIKEYDKTVVEVAGHTDSVGSD